MTLLFVVLTLTLAGYFWRKRLLECPFPHLKSNTDEDDIAGRESLESKQILNEMIGLLSAIVYLAI